jgi:hypothetical protein
MEAAMERLLKVFDDTMYANHACILQYMQQVHDLQREEVDKLLRQLIGRRQVVRNKFGYYSRTPGCCHNKTTARAA